MVNDKEELLKQMYFNGSSYRDIAIAINLSISTISRYIINNSLSKERKLQPIYDDLTGKEFGELEVISHVKTGRYKEGGVFQVWKCKCKQCGNINNIRAGNLKNGQKTCKKCSSKNLSDSKKECLIDYNIWYRMLDRSKTKDIEMTLTQQDCLDIFNSQNGKCALSGVPIYFGKTRSQESTASPDRINPKLGYVKNNVRWVHKFVNVMRNSISTEEFIWWCNTITQNNINILPNCFPPENVMIVI